MNHWLEMTRRRCLRLVLGTSVGVLAAVSLPGLNLRRSTREDASQQEAARWRRQLRSPESARVVGSQYLADDPQTETELISDLRHGVLRSGVSISDLSDKELGRRLRDRVRSDYSDQRTVRLDGWMLSRTEAQLCALYALGEMPA